MRFINAETGYITFQDGLCLFPGMPAETLHERFQNPSEGDLTVCLKAHELAGGSLALICVLDAQGLKAVTLTPYCIAGRQDGGADKQRAFLFAAFRLRDPCPDTRRIVKARYAFGTLTIATEPYTGAATARVDYNRQAIL